MGIIHSNQKGAIMITYQKITRCQSLDFVDLDDIGVSPKSRILWIPQAHDFGASYSPVLSDNISSPVLSRGSVERGSKSSGRVRADNT